MLKIIKRRAIFLKHTITHRWNKHDKDKYGLIYINRLNADFKKTGTIRIKTARNLLRNILDGMESIQRHDLRLIQEMQNTLTTISTNRDNKDVYPTQLDHHLETFANDLKTLMQRAELSNARKYNHYKIEEIEFSPSPSQTLKSKILSSKGGVKAPRRVSSHLKDVPPRTHRKRNNMLWRVTERFVEALTFGVNLITLSTNESPIIIADHIIHTDREVSKQR